jgi:PAS domain S-box-containing protein
MLGKDTAKLIPAEEADAQRTVLDELRRGRGPGKLLTRRLTRSGEAIDVELTTSPLRGDDGSVIGASVLARRLGEREQDRGPRANAERQLRAAEEEMRSLVERIPAVVYTAEVGPAGRCLFVSPQIAELVGYTPEEWSADPGLWSSRVHALDRERVAAEESEAARGKGRRLASEYRMFARNGRMVWVRDEGTLAPGTPGGPLILKGVLTDITGR